MMIIVGLGNVGSKYAYTLHNAGFIAIEYINSKLNPNNTLVEKFSAIYAVCNYKLEKILFIKPQTYMNNSGVCISQFKNFYKIENDQIFVFHDDIDLQPGQIKIKTGGGHGGHNGLKSLDAHIGNNYHRIRIGVGIPIHKEDVSNFVLSNFDDNNLKEIYTILNLFSDNINFLLEKQFSHLKNEITKL